MYFNMSKPTAPTSSIENQPVEVKAVFKSYPEPVRHELHKLRQVIWETAEETPGVDSLEETLKWGEPSYLSKIGSTTRIGWNRKDADHYRIYFNCKTTLVGTFREVYPEHFTFEGNRVISFQVGQPLDHIDALKHCIRLSLTYHKVKHLPLLGA